MSKSKERINKFVFIIYIIGSLGCVYVVIDSLIREDWLEALGTVILFFVFIVNPLYEGIKRYKK